MLCNSKSGFPVFDGVESSFDGKHFVICGGGGSAKSGVANCVSLCCLGPRNDGHPGVSLVQIANFETGAQLATSCCLINVTTVACCIGCDVIISERRGEENVLVEVCRETLDGNIEVLRFASGWLVAGTAAGSVLVFQYDHPKLKPLTSLAFHVKPIVDICFCGPLLATASADDTVRIWNLETGKAESVLPADVSSNLVFRRCRFSSPQSSTIRLYTLQVPKNRKGASFLVAWERRDQANEPEWYICGIERVAPLLATALGVSPGGKYIAVGSADLSVSVLDSQSLKQVRVTKKIHGLPVTGLFFRGPYVVSTSADATCAMVRVDDIGDVDLGKLLKTIFLVLSMLSMLICALIVFMVGKSVNGNAARSNFIATVMKTEPVFDLSRVDVESVSRFVNDFMWK